jgi:hypothetical protein
VTELHASLRLQDLAEVGTADDVRTIDANIALDFAVVSNDYH